MRADDIAFEVDAWRSKPRPYNNCYVSPIGCIDETAGRESESVNL